MTDKRGPKGAPIRVGDDFNDEEATLLDVSLDAVRAAVQARAEAERQRTGAEAKTRAPPPSVADDDLEKTEMLERPDLDDQPAPAPARGVVPLGGDAARLLGKTGRGEQSPPKTESYPALLSDEAETVMLSRPPRTADDEDEDPRPEPEDAPPVRALDELTYAASFDDPSDDKTLSRPKIARMTFRKGAPPRIDEEPDGATDETRKRRPDSAGAATTTSPRPLPPPPAPRIRKASALPAKSAPSRSVVPPPDPAADDD